MDRKCKWFLALLLPLIASCSSPIGIVKKNPELKQELIQHVRKTIGSIIVMKDIEFVNMLPKTRSGKLMRRVLKALLTDKDLGDLSTVEEEASVDEIKDAVARLKRS